MGFTTEERNHRDNQYHDRRGSTAPKVDDPTKRPLPTIHEMQGWATLGEVELIAWINDVLDHVNVYQRLVDRLSWRLGLEEGWWP